MQESPYSGLSVAAEIVAERDSARTRRAKKQGELGLQEGSVYAGKS
jgi:hypothetical protein